MTKRIDPPFGKQHHPHRPDPSQFQQLLREQA